ncbi:hypothetical protein QLS71_017040 [Mariniflexile litorale]|uniref:Uncharacterized protein n=1 Tax=Mariniflexile litorale TaxID=3045158 RepID=A0AAU7EFV0_9FLAO|nr:hypothetical protein [Mariniflexile sp. KMM 9835]MDQ8211551.1 hypothetical protein [Mariniflexile sp. KMM 9835]
MIKNISCNSIGGFKKNDEYFLESSEIAFKRVLKQPIADIV